MKQKLINTYAFNLRYSYQLVDDVEDGLMAVAPSKGLENHPAFTLGHLVSAAALTSKYLGGPYVLKPEWESLFKRMGPGDPRIPETNANVYPSKKELLDELSHCHKIVEDLILNMDESRFDEAARWRFSSSLPTMGDLLFFMCITHESMHLGQVAGWRRAMGLPSALAEM